MQHLPWLIFASLLFLACPPRVTAPEVSTPTEEDTMPPDDLLPLGTAVFDSWRHAPLHPGNGVAVTFSAAGKEAKKVARIALAVYEYELYTNEQGLPSKRKRPNGIWGVIAEERPAIPSVDFSFRHTFSDGFPAASNVEYVFSVYATDGSVSRQMALFDAGDSPWPTDKILLYATSREALDRKINLCFFPDTDFQQDWSAFLSETADLIFSGYHQNNKIKDHKDRWAFYYTRQETDGLALSQDPFNPDRYPPFMTDTLIMGIDAFGLLHRNPYSDGAYINSNIQFLAQSVFTSESYNWGTAIHETAHVVFHLSDEYSGCQCFASMGTSNIFRERSACQEFNVQLGYPAEDCTEIVSFDGETWYLAEKPPLFATEAACQAYNEQNGLPRDSCRLFQDLTGTLAYQAFKGVCIMQDDGDRAVPAFRHACGASIEEYYEKLVPPDTETGAWVLTEAVDNLFGYQPVMVFSVAYDGEEVGMVLKEVSYGVPTKTLARGSDLHVQLQDPKLGAYQLDLDRPDCVHIHHGKGEVALELASAPIATNIAVPLMEDIHMVKCTQDKDGKVAEFKAQKNWERQLKAFRRGK